MNRFCCVITGTVLQKPLGSTKSWNMNVVHSYDQNSRHCPSYQAKGFHNVYAEGSVSSSSVGKSGEAVPGLTLALPIGPIRLGFSLSLFYLQTEANATSEALLVFSLRRWTVS